MLPKLRRVMLHSVAWRASYVRYLRDFMRFHASRCDSAGKVKAPPTRRFALSEGFSRGRDDRTRTCR
nr:MAG TPA: hypothetical protein [Caudoviricetes sp.]